MFVSFRRNVPGAVNSVINGQVIETLTSEVVWTVDYCVVLFLVPSRILFFTGERCAYFCHLTGVLTAPTRVDSAPVQARTSEE